MECYSREVALGAGREAATRVRPFLENSTACTMFNANFIEPQLTSFGVGMDSFD